MSRSLFHEALSNLTRGVIDVHVKVEPRAAAEKGPVLWHCDGVDGVRVESKRTGDWRAKARKAPGSSVTAPEDAKVTDAARTSPDSSRIEATNVNRTDCMGFF